MMVAPAETPETTPVAEPIVANVPVRDQEPPEVASDNVVLAPAQTVEEPMMAAGAGLTVTGVDTVQPAPRE